MSSRFFEDFRIGESFETEERVLSSDAVRAFLESTRISGAVYRDDLHCQRVGFRSRIVPELFIAATAQSLLEEREIFGDTIVAICGFEDLTFGEAVYENDRIRARARVAELKLPVGSEDTGRGQVSLYVAVLNQDAQLVARAVVRVVVASNSLASTAV